MVRFLSFLPLFLSLVFSPILTFKAEAAVVPSGVPQRTLCGGAIVLTEANAKDYISLHAYREGSSTNGMQEFYKNGTQYQVPTNKNFLVECVEIWSDTVSAGCQLVAGTTGAGAVGGTITYEFGATSIYSWPVVAANTWYQKSYIYRFDEDLFPGIQCSTTPIHAVIVHGREVDDLP